MARKFFRRRSFGGGGRGRGTREQLVWARGISSFTLSNVTPLGAIAIFDPAVAIATGLDERLTVRRIKLGFQRAITASVGALSAISFTDQGIYLGGTSETVRTPSLLAAADRQADWLYLRRSPFTNPSAGALLGITPILEEDTTIDVRAMRKVDVDQQIVAVFSAPTALFATSWTITITEFHSVLFQRTRR